MNAWIITRDLLGVNAVGVTSRRTLVADANAIGDHRFRMLDDDGEVYVEGLASDETFAPLDDYGMPALGCTSIQYWSKSGAWETL